jgi:hypothetical protein
MDDQTKQTEPKPRAVVPREPLVAQGNAPLAIVPTTFEQVWRLAQVATSAGTVKSPEQGSMIIMHGLEIGIPPMMALERIAIINGRKCIWGDGVPALPIARGLVEDWHEEIAGTGDEMTATCSVKRKGQKSWVIRMFSVADAKQAGLWQTEAVVKRRGRDGNSYETKNDSPWYRYPKRMLTMRARVAFRDAFPDVYSGLHLAEEMLGEHPMRDVTPRETFRKVENPLADLPEHVEDHTEEECEASPRMSEEELLRGLEDLLPPSVADEQQPPEARGGDKDIAFQQERTQRHVRVAAAEASIADIVLSIPDIVVNEQQPQEARREPAGEPKPVGAVPEQAAAKNEPAAVLRDLVAKANAKAPETFPLEVTGEAIVKTDIKPQAKTPPAPAVGGNGFLPEALAIVANAVDAGKLNRWWRESRKQRTEAGLTAAELDQLTQSYNRKFIQLSET